MADIVQLKENGVSKYLKTHFKAVEGIDVELAKKQDVIKDTGWIDINVKGASVPTIKIRRIGNLIKLSSPIIYKTNTGDFIDFPVGFRPSIASFSESVVGRADTIEMLVIIFNNNKASIIRNTSNSTMYYMDSISFITDDAFPT